MLSCAREETPPAQGHSTWRSLVQGRDSRPREEKSLLRTVLAATGTILDAGRRARLDAAERNFALGCGLEGWLEWLGRRADLILRV